MESTTVSLKLKENKKMRSLKIKKPLRQEVRKPNDYTNRINQAVLNSSLMLIQDNKSSSRFLATQDQFKSALISKQ